LQPPKKRNLELELKLTLRHSILGRSFARHKFNFVLAAHFATRNPDASHLSGWLSSSSKPQHSTIEEKGEKDAPPSLRLSAHHLSSTMLSLAPIFVFMLISFVAASPARDLDVGYG